jgi:hypothetical protein
MLVASPLSKNLQKRIPEEHVKPWTPYMEDVLPVDMRTIFSSCKEFIITLGKWLKIVQVIIHFWKIKT